MILFKVRFRLLRLGYERNLRFLHNQRVLKAVLLDPHLLGREAAAKSQARPAPDFTMRTLLQSRPEQLLIRLELISVEAVKLLDHRLDSFVPDVVAGE